MIIALALSGCASQGTGEIGSSQNFSMIPATIVADQIVGQWGVAAYHQEAAKKRTETIARSECKLPYVIKKGPAGGVIMHLADNPTPAELFLKGGPGGKNFIGPAGELSASDREVVSISANMFSLRWMDPEIAGRYGIMIYARCGKSA
jgi:hypothetical protein